MADKVAVGFYPAAGEMAAPNNVVTGIEGEVYLHALAFGSDPDKGRTLPVGTGATVVFRHHEGAMGHLGVPVGDKYGIERLGLAYLRALDHDHEVRDHGIEQTQLCFGRGCEVVKGAGLYELTLKEECSFLLHLTA